MKRYKILVVPGYRIFPIDSGGAHGQLTFLDKQQQQHDIDIVLTPENIDESDIPAFSKRFPKLQILPVGFQKLSGTKKAKAFLLKQWRKISGKDLSYTVGKSKQPNGFFINNPVHVEAVSRFAAAKKYDIIQVEHVKNMGLIAVLPAAVKKIFVHHEIYFSRVQQDMQSLSYNSEFVKYMSGMAEAVEISWLKKYDGIISFNADDTEMLADKGITSPQQVAQPFALFEDELDHIYQPSAPQQLAFVGGETHYPNKEGLTWFLENIFPAIKEKVPDVLLKVTGNWSEATQALYKSNNITFTGFVDDIDSILRTSILVVPIRIGSGVRVKVFTSFAKGLPMVSTTLGASGIPGLKDKENIFLADEAAPFAEAVCRLLTDLSLRKSISDNAFLLAKENFGTGTFVEERNQFYNELIGV